MIAIIDFGSQTTHLIGRRLRDVGVSYQYIEPENALEKITSQNTKGIILSGGPNSVYSDNTPHISQKIYKLNIPRACFWLPLFTKNH